MSMRGPAYGAIAVLLVFGVFHFRGAGDASTRRSADRTAPPACEERVDMPSAPAPVQPWRPLVASSSANPTSLDEAPLMEQLRRIKDTDPATAIDLARQGNARFPDSGDAPERSSILIHALATQGRSSEARGVAEDTVNRYPDSAWVQEIERFTGAHRHRTARVNEAGALEFF